MGKQKIHLRRSKKGILFMAGNRLNPFTQRYMRRYVVNGNYFFAKNKRELLRHVKRGYRTKIRYDGQVKSWPIYE